MPEPTQTPASMPGPADPGGENSVPDDVRAAIRELIQADLAMHPVYGNTSACSGGIGGASITAHCAELCPNPTHDAARERHETALRRLARWLDGAPLDDGNSLPDGAGEPR